MSNREKKYTIFGENNKCASIVRPLLTWFSENARRLPWREDKNPYRIWVSEIMLQQTRVEAVKPYFARFMEELPSIADLADCEEERLLKLWEGLGYYSRVRNMKIAANQIMERYGGKMPADYKEVLSLKGIGSYTAGAVCSIAYEIPVPAVDGNVLRVLMRIHACGEDISRAAVKTAVEEALLPVMPQGESGAFNQSLMELGATVCLPNGEPLCEQCPVKQFCSAYQEGKQTEYPVKAAKKERRIENKTVLLISDGEKILLKKRPPKGLLAGLYEFPNMEGHCSEEDILREVGKYAKTPLYIEKIEDAKHIFSHVEWHMQGYYIKVDSWEENELFVEVSDILDKYPVPSAFEAYRKYLFR